MIDNLNINHASVCIYEDQLLLVPERNSLLFIDLASYLVVYQLNEALTNGIEK